MLDKDEINIMFQSLIGILQTSGFTVNDTAYIGFQSLIGILQTYWKKVEA